MNSVLFHLSNYLSCAFYLRTKRRTRVVYTEECSSHSCNKQISLTGQISFIRHSKTATNHKTLHISSKHRIKLVHLLQISPLVAHRSMAGRIQTRVPTCATCAASCTITAFSRGIISSITAPSNSARNLSFKTPRQRLTQTMLRVALQQLTRQILLPHLPQLINDRISKPINNHLIKKLIILFISF